MAAVNGNIFDELKVRGLDEVIAFITDYQAVDRIIDHLKLVFVAEKPPHSWSC
jgi:hypothetical protein